MASRGARRSIVRHQFTARVGVGQSCPAKPPSSRCRTHPPLSHFRFGNRDRLVSTSASGPSPLPHFRSLTAAPSTRLASPPPLHPPHPTHRDRTSRPHAAMPGASSSWGPSPAVVTAVVALLGLGLAGYIVGPPLYWHVAEALGRSPAACPACDCDCDARPLLSLPEDCSKQFKEVRGRASGEETEKSFTELLIEELKQREEEATEAQQHADVKLLEAKKLASQYQKEADKCSSGMDTCEEAREKSADALLEQKKLTVLWEERARELGWKPGNIKPHRK